MRPFAGQAREDSGFTLWTQWPADNSGPERNFHIKPNKEGLRTLSLCGTYYERLSRLDRYLILKLLSKKKENFLYQNCYKGKILSSF